MQDSRSLEEDKQRTAYGKWSIYHVPLKNPSGSHCEAKNQMDRLINKNVMYAENLKAVAQDIYKGLF